MQFGQSPKEEFEKIGFPVFAILWKNFQGRSGRGQGIWGYKFFECATYSVGVIGKNALA